MWGGGGGGLTAGGSMGLVQRFRVVLAAMGFGVHSVF